MSLLTTMMLVAGLALLVGGAELLVRGASRLAAAAGISPLVIGLTVVAYGTSAPEMAVSVKAALADQADLSIGNVVGSNIFNILFILGVSAMITPLAVSQQLLRRDVPLMIGVTALFAVLALDSRLGRVEGMSLLAGAIAYTAWSIRQSRREAEPVKQEYDEAFGSHRAASRHGWLLSGGCILAGLAALVLGSGWLVRGAVTLAQYMGVSELVIALTIVAAGTSLPELATSVVASIRGERDIAVGNVVGSNLFNILAILGVAAMLTPGGLVISSAAMHFDIPVMLGVAVLCLPIFFSGSIISRWEGLLFFVGYVAYTVCLILDATGSAASQPVRWGALVGGLLLLLWMLLRTGLSWRAARRLASAPCRHE
ncbi:MAG: calcium/sodium antiporter [Phycisphaerae bacterium]|nr:calcium/sodium antiporter [Phycisphaerae bacterium]